MNGFGCILSAKWDGSGYEWVENMITDFKVQLVNRKTLQNVE